MIIIHDLMLNLGLYSVLHESDLLSNIPDTLYYLLPEFIPTWSVNLKAFKVLRPIKEKNSLLVHFHVFWEIWQGNVIITFISAKPVFLLLNSKHQSFDAFLSSAAWWVDAESWYMLLKRCTSLLSFKEHWCLLAPYQAMSPVFNFKFSCTNWIGIPFLLW